MNSWSELVMSALRWLIGLGCMSILVMPLASAAENLVMPQQLVEKAREKGCEQITEFFRRPGIVGPPFAIWSARDGSEGATAFWCQKGDSKTAEYWLVVDNRAKQSPFTSCASMIKTKNYPGGLSIRIEKVRLDAFVNIKDPSSRGPSVVPKSPTLVSEYDGTAELFHCYNGEWFVFLRH